VPLFLTSIFYLMRSGAPLPLRLLLSFWILSIPAYHLTLTALESWSIRGEIFLIPSNYRGHVKVAFDTPGGVPEEMEGKNVVFRIAPDGLLNTRVSEPRLKYRDSERYAKRQFYLVDASGVRTKIEQPEPYDLSLVPADKVILSLAGEHFQDKRVILFDFYVGTPEQIKAFWNQR
jgi:hypothetical protein